MTDFSGSERQECAAAMSFILASILVQDLTSRISLSGFHHLDFTSRISLIRISSQGFQHQYVNIRISPAGFHQQDFTPRIPPPGFHPQDSTSRTSPSLILRQGIGVLVWVELLRLRPGDPIIVFSSCKTTNV